MAEVLDLFGASNQLLAALTLLSVTVWLHEARRRIAFTLLPMIFVLTITLWALGKLTWLNLQATQGFDVELLNGVAALLLILLALYLALSAVVKLRTERRGGDAVVVGVLAGAVRSTAGPPSRPRPELLALSRAWGTYRRGSHPRMPSGVR